jgi:hypothetical protein
MKRLLALLISAALLGCSTVYTPVVTLTQVADAAMKDWASASARGQTTADLDKRVIAVHDNYRLAAGIASDFLKQYKATGNQADYLKALEVARTAVDNLVSILAPILTPAKAVSLKTQLATASAP